MSAAAVERPPSDLRAYKTPATMTSTGGLSVSEAAMMAAIFEGCSSVGERSDTNILINSMQLVEPPKKSSVPNHLLETKIYSNIVQNSVVQARPAILNFAGFYVGRTCRLKLDLVNASVDVQRMHIIPPQTKYFRIEYTKKLKLVPGLAISCVVEFCPDECRYYYDCIRIHCKGEDNLVIPIHAYPILNTSEFPSIIDFALVPVGEMKTRVFPLRSVAPIDFEFRFTLLESLSCFAVQPISGVVPANGEVDIYVSFKPSSFQTATAKLQLQVVQFLSKPLICKLLGRSTPGLLHDISLQAEKESRSKPQDIVGPTSSTLDPSLFSPLARSRSRKAKISASAMAQTTAEPATEMRNGLLLPPNLDTPHAVSWVLNQKTGQLKMKHLQQAMQQQKSGTQKMSRQMKEAHFEMAVRQTAQEERQNQLRWQVKYGDELATPEFQVKVIDDRIEDWKIYKKLRGDANLEEECCRSTTEVIMRRTHRDALTTAPAVAKFDAYSNDVWAARQNVLTRFQQAARKVIVRSRMIPRLRSLQRYLRENDAVMCSASDSVSQTSTQPERLQSEAVDRYLFAASNVTSVTFPVYLSPTAKDDLAVDNLGPILTVPSVVDTEPIVPYYPLQVPQYSKLYGYRRFDVQQAATSYVKPISLTCLRSGPEDQPVDQPMDQPMMDTAVTESRDQVGLFVDEAMAPAHTQPAAAAELIPPAGLFKPIRYAPLHIFNPAPGLMTMLAPLPYSETDPDFHVCPLPRFASSDGDVVGLPSMNPPKQFLDRQEIIKGVMTWKKLASPSVAATASVPTLSNVWVPRWNDTFGEELLPTGVPCLRNGLEEDDETCAVGTEEGLDDGSEPVHLTMQMVKAEFASMEAACMQEESTQDAAPVGKKGEEKSGAKAAVQPVKAPEVAFPLGNKLPPTNLPTSDTGPVPRGNREVDLGVFLQRKRDILGRKIDVRVATIDRLKKDSSLILK